MSWVVPIWNLLMIIGIVTDVASAHTTTNQCVQQFGAQGCPVATTAGAAFGPLQLFKCATHQDPTGSLLNSTRQNGLQPPGTPGGVGHRPEPVTEPPAL